MEGGTSLGLFLASWLAADETWLSRGATRGVIVVCREGSELSAQDRNKGERNAVASVEPPNHQPSHTTAESETMIPYSLLAASALLSPALALAYVYQPDYDAQQPHQLVFPPPPSVENSHPPSLDYVDTNHLYDADTGRETYEGWSVHRLDIANDKVRAEMIQTAEVRPLLSFRLALLVMMIVMMLILYFSLLLLNSSISGLTSGPIRKTRLTSSSLLPFAALSTFPTGHPACSPP
jgi:uncharacterized membrane protein (DUF485 family)